MANNENSGELLLTNNTDFQGNQKKGKVVVPGNKDQTSLPSADATGGGMDDFDFQGLLEFSDVKPLPSAGEKPLARPGRKPEMATLPPVPDVMDTPSLPPIPRSETITEPPSDANIPMPGFARNRTGSGGLQLPSGGFPGSATGAFPNLPSLSAGLPSIGPGASSSFPSLGTGAQESSFPNLGTGAQGSSFPSLGTGAQESSFPNLGTGAQESSFPNLPTGAQESSFPAFPSSTNFPNLPTGAQESSFPNLPTGAQESSFPAFPSSTNFPNLPTGAQESSFPAFPTAASFPDIPRGNQESSFPNLPTGAQESSFPAFPSAASFPDIPRGTHESSFPSLPSTVNNPNLSSFDPRMGTNLPGLPSEFSQLPSFEVSGVRPAPLSAPGFPSPPLPPSRGPSRTSLNEGSIPAIDPRLDTQLPGLPQLGGQQNSAARSLPEGSHAGSMPGLSQSDLLSNLPQFPDGGSDPFAQGLTGEASIPGLPERPGTDPFGRPLTSLGGADPFKLEHTAVKTEGSGSMSIDLPARPALAGAATSKAASSDEQHTEDEVNLDALEIIQPEMPEEQIVERRSRAVGALRPEYLERKKVSFDFRVVGGVAVALVLIGVVLGQTPAGYFGINLFSTKKRATIKRQETVKFERIDYWVKQDTPLAYRMAMTRLRNYMRKFPEREDVVTRYVSASLSYADKTMISEAELTRLRGVIGGRIPFPNGAVLNAHVAVLDHKIGLARKELAKVRLFLNKRKGKKEKKKIAAATGFNLVLEMHYASGLIHLFERENRRAATSFRAAQRLDASSDRIGYQLAVTQIALKNYAAAKRQLQRIIKRNKTHYFAQIGLATLAILQGNPAKARKDLLTLLKSVKPNDVVTRGLIYQTIAQSHLAQEHPKQHTKYLELAYKTNRRDEALVLKLVDQSLQEGSDYLSDAQRKLEHCQLDGCRSKEFFERYVTIHIRLRRFSDAFRWLLAGQRRYPQHVGLKYMKAKIEEGKGRLTLASSLYRKLTQSNPTYDPAYFALADLMKRQKDIKGEVAILTTATQFSNHPAPAYLRLGKIHLTNKQWAKAESAFRLAIGADASLVEARINLGYVLMHKPLKEWTKAIEQFKAVEKHGVNSKRFYKQFAHAYFMANRYDAAFAIYNKILAGDKDTVSTAKNPDIFLRLGIIFISMKKLDKAVKMLHAAKRSSVHEARANYYLGQIEILRNRPRRALKMFSQAIAGDPSNLMSHYYYAQTLQKAGGSQRSKLALQTYNYMIRQYKQRPELAEKYGNVVEVYYNRGLIYLKSESWSRALADFEAALLADTEKTKVIPLHERLVISYFKTEQKDKTVEYAKILLGFDKNNGVAHYYLGLVYRMKEDYKNAYAHLEKNLKSNRVFPDTYRMLGYHYRDKGLKEKAITYLQTYLKLIKDNSDYYDYEEVEIAVYRLQGKNKLNLDKHSVIKRPQLKKK